MNCRETILLYNTLGDQDRVLEVVTVPRHERDQHVLAKRQFTDVGRGTVSQHVALGYDIALADERPLVDTGVLVGTRVFDQIVDVDAWFARPGFVVVDAHHDAAFVGEIHLPAPGRPHPPTPAQPA